MSSFNFIMNSASFADEQVMANEVPQTVPMVLGENVFHLFTNKDTTLPLGQTGNIELANTVESPISTAPSSSTISPLELLNLATDDVLNSNSSSPMFQDLELDPTNWNSLFDDVNGSSPTNSTSESDDNVLSDVISEAVANITNNVNIKAEEDESSVFDSKSLKRSADSIEPEEAPKRKKSSKVDHLGCVAYNRKQRAAPLNPIVIPNDADTSIVKRARNTEAARRSRARKMERMNQLETKVEDLLNRNKELEAEVERLKALLSNK